jgi:hypothetical protein
MTNNAAFQEAFSIKYKRDTKHFWPVGRIKTPFIAKKLPLCNAIALAEV